MTIYSLDVFLFQFWTNPLVHVWFYCCFLTCIQVSQEAGRMAWYSPLFKNFQQFVVIHTTKGFSTVNEAEADVFSGILLPFLWPSRYLISAFLKSSCTSGSSQFMCCCCSCFDLICSVTQLCLTLCSPMDCSTPGFPVLHHLLEFAQTHVHWVVNAIHPSHPLSSPSPPAFNLSQQQGLFQWVSSLHQVAKVLKP